MLEFMRKPWLQKGLLIVISVCMLVPLASMADKGTSDLIPSTENLKRKEKQITNQEIKLDGAQMPQAYRSMEQAKQDGVGYALEFQTPELDIVYEDSPWKQIAKNALFFLIIAAGAWFFLSRWIVKKYGHLVNDPK